MSTVSEYAPSHVCKAKDKGSVPQATYLQLQRLCVSQTGPTFSVSRSQCPHTRILDPAVMQSYAALERRKSIIA